MSYNRAGFPANTNVTMTWRRESGVTQNGAVVRTNSSGAKNGTVVVPPGPAGLGQLRLKAGSIVKNVTVEIRPVFEILISHAKPGMKVPFTLSGAVPY